MTRSRTYIAIPPGFTIKEQLEDREMSQKEFAARMGFSQKHVSQLIKGDVQLTPETASKLEMVLGIPARFWNNLESIYQEKLQKANAENQIDEEIARAKHFPYAEMAKQGWVIPTRKQNERVVQLRHFFEVANLGYLDKDELIMPIACRRKKESEDTDYALMAWTQQVKREARKINTAKYNPTALQNSLEDIRHMTMEDPSDFGPRLIELLSRCGIALVYLAHLKGSYLNAATFIDGSKYVVGMSVRGRAADIFWFNLFHELGHILYGHINQDEGTSQLDESKADSFASDALIPSEEFEMFVNSCALTRPMIRTFANEIGIAPGIVVGRLQKEGLIEYSQFNDLKQQYKIVD